jgi:ferredoxin
LALLITDECINCDVCEPECPNDAISQGEEIYVIDPAEMHRMRRPLRRAAVPKVCPVDCIPLNPAFAETHEQLYAKYLRLTSPADNAEVPEKSAG